MGYANLCNLLGYVNLCKVMEYANLAKVMDSYLHNNRHKNDENYVQYDFHMRSSSTSNKQYVHNLMQCGIK